jgi:glycosyltransferase involved in cell wall biosynthesis
MGLVTGTTRHSVAFVTRELNTYRIPFFESTKRLLEEQGVDFRVVLSGATAQDRAKGDNPDLAWTEQIPAHEFTLRGRDLWYSPIWSLARSCDLVITEQASKQLANVPLSVLNRLGITRHALWGHGRNFQASFEGTKGEGLKKWFTCRAHWFFAYTSASATALEQLGYPLDRITVFNNSTDVAELRRLADAIEPSRTVQIREELGLGSGPILGYIGGLYPPKRTTFLIDALTAISERSPDMEAVVIGSGSEATLLADAAAERPWLHYLGPMYGSRKVEVAQMLDLLVMPGLIGLNIVDGFGLGLPTVTTDIDWHSPEISYLEDGVNGLVTEDSIEAFSDAVVELLDDPPKLDELKKGAAATAELLGTDAMAERFTDGVLNALHARRRT